MELVSSEVQLDSNKSNRPLMIVSWLIVGVIVGMDEGSELGTPDGTYVGGAVAIIPACKI